MFVPIAGNRTSDGAGEAVSYFNATPSDRSLKIPKERYGDDRRSVEFDLGKTLSSLLSVLYGETKPVR